MAQPERFVRGGFLLPAERPGRCEGPKPTRLRRSAAVGVCAIRPRAAVVQTRAEMGQVRASRGREPAPDLAPTWTTPS